MDSLLITPKNSGDLKLILDLLQRLKMKVQILTEEQKEDLGLALLMQEADREEKVSRDEIIEKLSRA